MNGRTIWMPVYIGDYLGGTQHLTTVQHGAYFLLLMANWRMGHLPDDDRKLASIARLSLKAWLPMADTIRAFFVSPEPGKITQPRIAEEREKAESLSQKRAISGAAGKRVAMANALKLKEMALANAQAGLNTVTVTYTEEVHTEEHTPLNPPLAGGQRSLALAESLPVEKPKKSKRGGDDDPDFARFWAAYPRKVGKGQARKAWAAATGRFPASEVLAGLQGAKWPSDARYIPYPATWLNGERWADQEPDNSLGARLLRATSSPTHEIDWSNFDD